MQIYTIGHSNHPLERFLELLKQYHIELVVDIRALPRSRWAPWTNVKTLGETLAPHRIKYLWLGDKLGGRPSLKKDRSHKITAADFSGMAEKPSYKEGIRELMELAETHRTAIMCAEEDPARCHRELLIGETLRGKGVEVIHIRAKKPIQMSF